ncbi:hypothetical protein [Streptomyces sp. NPDC046197]|uniref:hypothetical protein n=1 Tax=Streptomyces sp. NPDC046197 TaxID=3154337 RepID=UPI0033FC3E5F
MALASAIAGTVLAGGLIAATPAQADVRGGGCRLKGWAGTTPGVLLDACSMLGAEGAFMGEVKVQNPNRLVIYVCAQLLRVHDDGSTNWAYDYKCAGPSIGDVDWYTPGEYPDDGGGYLGTYVIQVGYWYNGSYYGNAQSARITVT